MRVFLKVLFWIVLLLALIPFLPDGMTGYNEWPLVWRVIYVLPCVVLLITSLFHGFKKQPRKKATLQIENGNMYLLQEIEPNLYILNPTEALQKLADVKEENAKLKYFNEKLSRMLVNDSDKFARLSSIASHLSVPTSKLIIAYKNVQIADRVRLADFRELIHMGMPMMEELVKVIGGGEDGAIFYAVRDGKVTFDDLNQVIDNLTNEGGKFYNADESR